jgi:hypothetical protein
MVAPFGSAVGRRANPATQARNQSARRKHECQENMFMLMRRVFDGRNASKQWF